jgi:ribonuclease HI
MAKKSAASSGSVQRSILLVVSGLCHATLDSGGWGYVVCYPNGVEREGSGAAAETRVNQMELTAAIAGLKSIGREHRLTPVRVVSASRYLVEGAKGTRGRSTNADLWAQLDLEVKNRSVAWEWEPPDTLLSQSQAHDAARLALKRALQAGVSPEPGPR